jgi:hypothetical protein
LAYIIPVIGLGKVQILWVRHFISARRRLFRRAEEGKSSSRDTAMRRAIRPQSVRN